MNLIMFLSSIIVCIIFFIIIVFDVNKTRGLPNGLSDIGIRSLTILGIALILTAALMPFIIKGYFQSKIANYKTIADLGTIGDFIGGTTVAFLTAASVILLLATIIMQRKEIKISQQGIEELVKQTEASVRQAEEARKETQLTNDTMKRQQFETTFFNMINLHHNILNEIRIDDYTGRNAIEKLYEELIDVYDKEVYKRYSEEVKNRVLSGNKQLLDDLIKQLFIDSHLSKFKSNFEEDFFEHDEPDVTRFNFYNSLEHGTNKEWNSLEKDLLKVYERIICGDETEYKKILKEFNFNQSVNHIKSKYIDEFNEVFNINPLKRLKVRAYEEIYKKRENTIGHYYRNLYRIVKLIQSESFHQDKETNELEQRKYRGILRAQLSSFELLMIFYNVVYSKKGEKFRDLLKNTNFFDDHLIIDDFIWKNDIGEVNLLDLP